MRDAIWHWARRNYESGLKLPRRFHFLRAVLFPVEYVTWWIDHRRGYQFDTDTWQINGVTFSGEVLRVLAYEDGEVFRVRRDDNMVTLDRLTQQAWMCREPGPLGSTYKHVTATLAYRVADENKYVPLYGEDKL